MAERLVYTENVGGSSPSPPTRIPSNIPSCIPFGNAFFFYVLLTDGASRPVDADLLDAIAQADEEALKRALTHAATRALEQIHSELGLAQTRAA